MYSMDSRIMNKTKLRVLEPNDVLGNGNLILSFFRDLSDRH